MAVVSTPSLGGSDECPARRFVKRAGETPGVDEGLDEHGRGVGKRCLAGTAYSALRTAEGVADASCHAPRRTGGTLTEITKLYWASPQAGLGCP